jgi:hypothetical protein
MCDADEAEELSDFEEEEEVPGNAGGEAAPSAPGSVDEEDEDDRWADRYDDGMGEEDGAPHAPATTEYGVERVAEFVEALVSENQTAEFEGGEMEAHTARLEAAVQDKERIDAWRARAHADIQQQLARVTGGGAATGCLQLTPGSDRRESELYYRLDPKSTTRLESAPMDRGEGFCARLTSARGATTVTYLRGDPTVKRRRDQGDASFEAQGVFRFRFRPGLVKRRNGHVADTSNPAGRGVKLIVGDGEFEITGYRFLRPDDETATQLLMTIHARGTGVGLRRTKLLAAEALGNSVADVVAIWPDPAEDARRNVGRDGLFSFGMMVTPKEDDPLVREGPKSVRVGDKRVVFNSDKLECSLCKSWAEDQERKGLWHFCDKQTHKDHTDHHGAEECSRARRDKRRETLDGRGAAGGRGGGFGGAGGPGRRHRADTGRAAGEGGSGAGAAPRAGGRGGGGVRADRDRPGGGGGGRYDVPQYSARAQTAGRAEDGGSGPDAVMRPAGGGGGGSGDERPRGGESGGHQGGDDDAGRAAQGAPEHHPASLELLPRASGSPIPPAPAPRRTPTPAPAPPPLSPRTMAG